MRRFAVIGFSLSLFLVGCTAEDMIIDPDPEVDPDPEMETDPDPETQAEPGMVFALGNQAEGNHIVAFLREDDGSLSSLGMFPTGGLGRGGGLGSQGALVLSEDGQYLYAVNAGSDQISSFRVYSDHLALIDIVDSRGVRPVSVTTRGNRLYVLNAEAAGNVSGFALEAGRMVPIEGATMPLSTTEQDTAAAQVELSPDGKVLAVTERATNNITTYVVNDDGTLGAPIVTPSEGQTPFGFAFADEGWLVVSEAFGGDEGLSALSSYDAARNGTVSVVSSSVPSGQTAACWLVLAGGGRYAYTTNAQSNTISGYDVAEDGSLTLFDDEGITAAMPPESGPLDMAVSRDEQYLYVLEGRADTLVGYRIDEDGTLAPLDQALPIPATAVGLAGR